MEGEGSLSGDFFSVDSASFIEQVRVCLNIKKGWRWGLMVRIFTGEKSTENPTEEDPQPMEGLTYPCFVILDNHSLSFFFFFFTLRIKSVI